MNVFVSDNGGAFTPFRTDTTQTSAVFAGQFGHTYSFFSVATDNVGHRQPTPTSAQATTQLVLVHPPPVVEPAVIQFGNPQFSANVDAGSTMITLTRSGNLGAAVTVVLASPGGPGVPAFQATVSFGPNVTSQSVPIPISNDLLPGGTTSPSAHAVLSEHGGVPRPDGIGKAGDSDNNPPLVTVTSLRVATVKIGTGKKAKSTTGLVLQFSGHSTRDRPRSSWPTTSSPARSRKATSSSTSPPRFPRRSITPRYNLTLIPRRKLNLAQPEQLTITASLLTDSLGRPLDGNHNGQLGGDFVATLRGKAVTIAATRNPKEASFPRIAPELVDRVLGGETHLTAASPPSVRANGNSKT